MLSEMASTENVMILSITESHLTENIREAEITMKSFTHFRTDRSNQRKKGGVITYVKNHLAAEVIYSESNSFTEAHILYIRTINMIYINIYRPPACPTNKFLEPLTRIKNILENLPPPMPTIVLAGDLNFPLMNWDSERVYGGADDMRTQAEALVRFAQDLYLRQIINTPTRGENILDIVMTNCDELIHSIAVDTTNLSDHNMITITTNIIDSTPQCCVNEDQHTALSFNHLNFFSESVCWEKLKRDFNQIDWHHEMRDADPEDQYKKFLQKCRVVSEKYVPLRRAATKKNIPRDRKVLMRKRTKLRKKLRHTDNAVFKQRLKEKINILEEKLKISIEAEMDLKESQAVKCIRNNPKYFYKYAKTKSETKASVGPIKDLSGRTINDPQGIADLLRLQYESVYSEPQQDKIIYSPTDFFQVTAPLYSISDINFTTHDIEEAIKEITSNAAAGPDQFPAMLLKKCATELSVPLHMMFRRSLDSGVIPQQLKCAKVTPIYKGESRAETKNYRPVALTSHIIKTLEKLLVKNISEYLEQNDKMNQDQHGFRSGRSCLSQLLAHHQKVLTSLENNKDVDVVYLDFAKAFDKVDHGILLHKTRDLGILGKLGVWLHSFLTDREQVVAVDGALSKTSSVMSGVPQGSVLGPLLFLIHISDINNYVKYSSVASFADDTRVLKEVSSKDDADLLQADLAALYLWAEQNNMSFNNTKFEHLNYSTNRSISNIFNYTAHDGTDIDTKDHVKDLGVTISNDGNFKTHITNTAKKARSQAGWILRTFRTRDTLPMLTLYKSLVVPLLEYCCQLWSPWKDGEKQSLEAVQRSFTSKISEVRHLNYWERLKTLNLYSLERRRERYAILYIYKILIGSTTNNLNINFYTHQRLGRLCHVDRVHPRATTRVKTLKENAFTTKAPRLFNALPKHLRDTSTETSLEKFKTELGRFLQTIPDQPKLPHYNLSATSNSIIDQLAQRRAQGIY